MDNAIALGTLIFTVLGAVLAALFARRAGGGETGEEPTLSIAPVDRELLRDLRHAMEALREAVLSQRDASLSVGRRVDAATDAAAKLTRAIDDNTAELDRQRQ
jgi:hypothetical protein